MKHVGLLPHSRLTVEEQEAVIMEEYRLSITNIITIIIVIITIVTIIKTFIITTIVITRITIMIKITGLDGPNGRRG